MLRHRHDGSAVMIVLPDSVDIAKSASAIRSNGNVLKVEVRVGEDNLDLY